MTETHTNAERVRALEEENAELRRQLKEKQEIDEDLYSYRIFVEARRKLFAWIAGAAVLLTAFGLYSLQDIVSEVRKRVDEKATDQVIDDIKERIYSEHEGRLKLALERQVVDLVKGQIPVILAKVEDTIRPEAPDAEVPPVVTVSSPDKILQSASSAGLYYVVAGSSPVKQDLERELRRVKDEVGSEFAALFPNVEIYPPLGRNTNYALVVDGNLSRTRAAELKQLAIREGFRDDTFLWKADKVTFTTAAK